MQPVCFENFRHFPIALCSREIRYQALSTFLYCKRRKAGQAWPGNEATVTNHMQGNKFLHVARDLPVCDE